MADGKLIRVSDDTHSLLFSIMNDIKKKYGVRVTFGRIVECCVKANNSDTVVEWLKKQWGD